jgi:hypothetical protein
MHCHDVKMQSAPQTSCIFCRYKHFSPAIILGYYQTCESPFIVMRPCIFRRRCYSWLHAAMMNSHTHIDVRAYTRRVYWLRPHLLLASGLLFLLCLQTTTKKQAPISSKPTSSTWVAPLGSYWLVQHPSSGVTVSSLEEFYLLGYNTV